ncbi:hypothetical protein SE17_35120 [Kouleothrix aurantiaca]|uniref:Uncharacterized protein n=1 Tax=Kouleothrix aurantiaca TaxID=186479 RepID=A0A0P9CSI9_9CHLR|nr:hypothetical protein SE17_35120 [Kouleothrix aurantiaca]
MDERVHKRGDAEQHEQCARRVTQHQRECTPRHEQRVGVRPAASPCPGSSRFPLGAGTMHAPAVAGGEDDNAGKQGLMADRADDG